MNHPVLVVHGPAVPEQPLVLDSPHSGFAMPADFGSVRTAAELRDGEDCFIDELYLPVTARGVPLLAAQFPRTYIDANRHAGDIDLDLLTEPWPDEPLPYTPSGKARIGKALVWRTLDDGRPLYDRRLSVAEGGAGIPRADFVLGDRDGTTCAPAFTAFVRDVLVGLGYEVKVNDPFKGVELVRAYANPAAGRHSLQLEINKRLYMDSTALARHAGFGTLQAHLLQLADAILRHINAHTPRHHPPEARHAHPAAG